MNRSGGRAAHEAFLVVIGALGWWTVAWAAGGPAVWPSLGPSLLFLGVVAGARSLAFPVAGEAEISLDAAIFIAATACLGARATAIGLGALLTLDVLARGIARRRPARSTVAGALYLGGLSAGLLAVWARLFGVGAAPPTSDDVWRVPAFGLLFLLSHYLVQTLQLRLSGRPLRDAIRRNLVGVIAEATLLPLASVIVLIWNPRQPVPFALLGLTYVLVNYGFRRVGKLAADLRRRVDELEALNRTAHALGASLETPQLVSALLRETARALPRASRVEGIVRIGGETTRFVVEADGEARRLPVGDDARALLQAKEARLDEEPELAERPGVRARLVAPLSMYGETVGVLSAESRYADAFGPHELRLLDAIASQAAAAVENARLYELANVDGLTGLYCRRYFDVRIAEEIERARRFGTSFALVMADLDDFKRLNDTLGHLAGDRALREIAAIAASQLRGVDLAARYGGEELAFLLPRTNLSDAHAVAERIRAAVAGYSLVDVGRTCPVTLSLGVAGWTESGATDPAMLVARADAALYRAKAAGKNRVEIDLNFELTPALAPVRRRRA